MGYRCRSCGNTESFYRKDRETVTAEGINTYYLDGEGYTFDSDSFERDYYDDDWDTIEEGEVTCSECDSTDIDFDYDEDDDCEEATKKTSLKEKYQRLKEDLK